MGADSCFVLVHFQVEIKRILTGILRISNNKENNQFRQSTKQWSNMKANLKLK